MAYATDNVFMNAIQLVPMNRPTAHTIEFKIGQIPHCFENLSEVLVTGTVADEKHKCLP